jgi:hypothetical protein
MAAGSRLSACPASVPVPRASELGTLLQTLIGHPVEVRPALPVVPDRDHALVAVYVTDGSVTGAVVACELSLAAHAGAALARLSAAEAEQSVAAGTLSAELADNAHEVLNVLTTAFREGRAPDLMLHQVHAVDAQLPLDVGPTLRYVMRRLDVQLEIVGYGGGRLSVVAVA